MHAATSVGFFHNRDDHGEKAAGIAGSLGIPLVTDRKQHDLILEFLDDSLRLSLTRGPLRKSRITAEFVKGHAAHRRKQGGRELLRRALGAHPQRRLNVLDATGGLGRDAFQMAQYGCRVSVYERNPVVAALLRDGLRRARAAAETRAIAGRITLHCGDSLVKIRQLHHDAAGHWTFDVIYLDPMFPRRTKSALVKKEMQILQVLLGHEDNGPELLEAALNGATAKVVVKRPARAVTLAGPKPSHSITGRTTRFDVYLIP